MAKPEFATLDAARGVALAAAAANLQAGCTVPLGLGTAVQAGCRCYFVVVEWPEAQALREEAGLPRAWLHSTTGFDSSDVHGVAKGPLQLMPLDGVVVPWRAWTPALAMTQRVAETARGSCGGMSTAEALALFERLLQEASLTASVSERVRLLCSRCDAPCAYDAPHHHCAATVVLLQAACRLLT